MSDAHVYQRIINTLQQIHGQPSLLTDIRAIRQQISGLHQEASLQLSRLTSSRDRLNYHLKPEPKEQPRQASPNLSISPLKHTVYTQQNESLVISKLTNEKSSSVERHNRPISTRRSPSPPPQPRSKSGMKKSQAQSSKTRHKHLAYVPSNKLYHSRTIQLRMGERLALAKESKSGAVKGERIDGTVYRFDAISIDQDSLFHRLLEKPGSSVLFIGHKGSGKRKLLIDWFVAQVNGLLELARMQSRKSLCSITLEYHETYIFNKETETVRLIEERSTFSEYQDFSTSQDKVLESMSAIRTLAQEKRVKMPGVIRLRKIRLRFVDGFGSLLQQLVTSNGLNCRNQYKFTQEGQFIVVWCLNPLYMHYRGCKATLEASCRLFHR